MQGRLNPASVTAAVKVSLTLKAFFEIMDGNLSLNILKGKVISYGDSFYRGPPPDVTETGAPNPFTDFNPDSHSFEGHQYSLQS
ncbi:hypothetical protein FS837_011007 [Tulasnella sp. UAMH 9824]|nr:hypothetical protein FS837_011007 [Tulasnella sp. UAMH 9824]